MKTKIEDIATIIASAIWADGVYDPAEKVTVEEIAEALELDETAFNEAVDKQIAQLEKMPNEEVNALLDKVADDVADDEIGIVFEAVLQMLLCDGELSRTEVTNMLVIADALGIETEDAVLLLADMLQEETDIVINLDEE